MRVTLYSKPGCHLCDDVKEMIEQARRNGESFQLEIVSILDSAGDFSNYQHAIPVVAVDGDEVGRYRMTGDEFAAALHPLRRVTAVVMAKLPAPGRVKTRLQLEPDHAARLQGEWVRHIVKRLRNGDWKALEVHVDPNKPAVEWVGDVTTRPQLGDDLGQRLANAKPPAGEVLFFGTDSPDVPSSAITRAARLLICHDVVLGPTEDGGYWCLGLKQDVDGQGLLGGIDWSSGREFGQTLERARSLGYKVATADRWDDVDHPEDLRRLIARLKGSQDPADRELLNRLAFLPDGVAS